MAAHPLDEPVSDLMRTVGREVVMRRFRALGEGEISEKTPGDLVTVADRESEERLAEGLTRLLPEARMIGEEAVAADPGLLNGIAQGLAWIVDPIDGTANYAAGESPFAIMVALVAEGETLAGWILDPATGRMLHAAREGGAFVDGDRIHARACGGALPRAAFATRYLPDDYRGEVRRRIAGKLHEVAIPGCAGEQYGRLTLGQDDVALFWRTHPWDHAPGALILAEAGGRIARLDGIDYRVGSTGHGLLAAASPGLWDQAHAVLAADRCGGAAGHDRPGSDQKR